MKIKLDETNDWKRARAIYEKVAKAVSDVPAEGREHRKKEPALTEGGGSSGNWGHKGRPGKQGGSLPKGVAYSLHGNVTTATIDRFTEAFEDIPAPIRQLVKSVELHEETGPEFGVGGSDKSFGTGASWEEGANTLRIYDVNMKGTDKLGDEISHEVGHAFQHGWWRAGADSKLGELRAEFQKAWASGEDGITPYSKAWGKSGKYGETVAEMSKIYSRSRRNYTSGKSGMKPAEALRLHNSLEAPRLTEAFLAAWKGMSGDTLAETLMEARQSSKAVKTETRLFDSEMRPATPKLATVAVTLGFDKDGLVVSSRVGTVRSNLAEHARHNQKSHGRRKGGSVYGPTYRHETDVADSTMENLQAELEADVPAPILGLVKKVEVRAGPGPGFVAGGQKFEAGGEWDRLEGRVTLYGAKDRAMSDLLGTMHHETGHAFQSEWWGASVGQQIEAKKKGTYGKYVTKKGQVKKEFKDIPKDHRLAASKAAWDRAWKRGEDGITSYSKAWGNPSETIAEMAKIYSGARRDYRLGRSRKKPATVLRKACKKDAPFLCEAFLVSWHDVGGESIAGLSEARKSIGPVRTETKLFDAEWRPAKKGEAVYAVTLKFDEDGLVVSSRTGIAESNLAELSEAKLNWRVRRRQLTKLQKAIFERFRYKDSDTRTIRAAVLEMKLDGFTEEIERLLRRAGCQRRAELTDAGIRDIIVAESEEEADSIVNTFNFELIGAILRIAGSKPKVTRKDYADGLREWEGARADYKGTQISQWTISRASNFAATLFFARNGSLLSGRGTAKLRGPRPAKEEICQGWFNRGRVPAEEMLADPPPYHLNCPHWADYRPGRVKSQDCSKLWVGG